GVWIYRGQGAGGALERARDGRVVGRVTRDVDGRRIVGVDLERRCHTLLRGEQARHVGVDLADLVRAINAWSCDAVAAGLLDAGEVVALIRREGEQRVAPVDAIRREAAEESAEGVVVRLQGRDVSRLAGAKGGWRIREVVVMRVRDVRIRHGHPVLLHRGDVTQGVVCAHAVEAGEAGKRRLAVDGGNAAERRCDVLVAEQTLKSRVPARLIAKEV